MFKRVLISVMVVVILVAILGGCSVKNEVDNELKVEVFKAKVASVNSFLVHNNEEGVLVDLLRSSEEAKELVEFVKSHDVKLSRIILTHGHADHYIGLDVITKAFPETPVYVYDQSIKDDIINFSTWMESVGWLEKEQALKVKSTENQNGFDYENVIQVDPKSTFTFSKGNVIELKTDYMPAEAESATTLYLPEEDIFIGSDLAYNGVHPWMGAGVALNHVENWKEQLKSFEKEYKTSVVYPGHGDKGDASIFSELYNYITVFQEEVSKAESSDDVIQKMIERYPDYKQQDFLLVYSAQNIFNLTHSK